MTTRLISDHCWEPHGAHLRHYHWRPQAEGCGHLAMHPPLWEWGHRSDGGRDPEVHLHCGQESQHWVRTTLQRTRQWWRWDANVKVSHCTGCPKCCFFLGTLYPGAHHSIYCITPTTDNGEGERCKCKGVSLYRVFHSLDLVFWVHPLAWCTSFNNLLHNSNDLHY